MCMYIRREVLLAHLLNFHPKAISGEGIDFSDIEKYCDKIKKNLFQATKHSTDYVYFGINANTLGSELKVYPEHFRVFMGKFYKGEGFNINYFSFLVDNNLRKILEKSAINF